MKSRGCLGIPDLGEGQSEKESMRSIETRLSKLEATTGTSIDLPEWCKNPSDVERSLCEMIAEGYSVADLMKAINGRTRGLPSKTEGAAGK